jgi:putative lipoprotein
MRLHTILWPLGLSLLAACAVTSTAGGATPSAPTLEARVTGSVTYLQRIALPPGAVIKVQLVDVSRADAPAVVLGEQQIQAEGRQPPFAFAIAYDPSRIQPNLSYAVGARIEDGGRLLFINDQRYAVLTRGAPKHVDMVLRAVGATRP